MTKLPLRYVNEYRDVRGKVRRYFRRPGQKRIPLLGLPGSDEFMAAYQAALAGVVAPAGSEPHQARHDERRNSRLLPIARLSRTGLGYASRAQEHT